MPEVKRVGQFKYYFWSREGSRVHIHIKHVGLDIEALVWMDTFEIKRSSGSKRIDSMTIKMARESKQDIMRAWSEHFGVKNED